VVGVGVNVGSFPHVDVIGQQATRIGLASTLSRETIALVTIRAIERSAKRFILQGLSPIVERWREVDAYQNQEVDLLIGDDRVSGTNVGINHVGHLLIETTSGLEEFSMGDVSLRPSVGESE
jgi:biotin-(acetyl-CoA carboxylase) ligase